MHVDERHLLVADAGDGVEVTHLLRPRDYGPQLRGTPLLGVNHVYGVYCAENAMSPRADGTLGCATRASSTARYPATSYLSRSGAIWQVIPFNRCGIHCEHSWKDPVGGEMLEINRISIGLEWAGLGWVRASGEMPGHRGIDVHRSDLELCGRLYWQRPPPEQIHAATLYWRAICERYPSLTPERAILGHGELAHGGHELCPGPLILSALRTQVLPALLQAGDLVQPDDADVFLLLDGEPICCSDPDGVFLEHGGQMTDEELRRYFSPADIERYAKCGALTHEDREAQQSTLAWRWNPDALLPPLETC